MKRTLIVMFALIMGMTTLVACQRHAPRYPPQTGDGALAQATELNDSSTPTQTATPSPSATATASPTPTLTPSPTITPTPTPTPIPSQRLAAAQQAFAWGDYLRAQEEFAALISDGGADETERQLAAFWVGRSAFEAKDYPTALTTLRDFVESYPNDARVPPAYFLRARAYERQEDWRGAMAAYQDYLDTSDNTLDVYAYEALGDAAMLALDYDSAIEAYTDGLQVAPDNSWTVHLREGIAQAELARDNPEVALAQYEAILSVARIADYRAKILYLAGQALIMAEDPDAAYERYAQAVNRYPEAHNSYLALVELVNAGVPVDDYQRGLVDYYAKAYQPAIEAFARYIEANPDPFNDDAHWYLALSLKANGNLLQSIQQFQELIETYPQNEHVSEAWLEMAQAHVWRDEVSTAIETYRTFADENPQSPLAVSALWRVARLQLAEGDQQAAAITFRDVAERYPQHEDAPWALFEAALIDYRLGSLESARDSWQTLLQTYPQNQAGLAAQFWLGKAWLALNKPDEAEIAFKNTLEWSPASYYGLRAADLLNGAQKVTANPLSSSLNEPEAEQADAEAWLQSWLPVTDTVSLSSLDSSIANSPPFRRGDALLLVGRRSDALREFEVIKNDWWDDPLAMYQLALAFRERGLYRLSIVCAERLIWSSPATSREDVPLFIQHLSYPLYYQELIVAEAQTQEIDPLLLFALIRQESLFEPSVISPADARGLTQVIPATGEWIAGRLGWGALEADDLLHPYVNIKLGARYLKIQIEAFDEEVFPALVAYNAGPGRARDWLTEVADLDLFVETIPYAESQRYVRQVYENYANYRRLYRSNP